MRCRPRTEPETLSIPARAPRPPVRVAACLTLLLGVGPLTPIGYASAAADGDRLLRRAFAGHGNLRLADFQRSDLGGGIVHDVARLRIGTGPFDAIRLHRVHAPSSAARAQRPRRAGVMLVHGARWGFAPTFLDAGGPPEADTSLAVHLAAAGIDVWGLDARCGRSMGHSGVGMWRATPLPRVSPNLGSRTQHAAPLRRSCATTDREHHESGVGATRSGRPQVLQPPAIRPEPFRQSSWKGDLTVI